MATTNGSAAPDYHSRPLAYVAIPLAVVVTLGLIAMVLHTQRRKHLLKQQLRYPPPNRGARTALERDLQDGWLRGAPPEERQRQQLQQQRRGAMMRRWSRNGGPDGNGGGRWAWARELLGSRSEEGLNEFGEAPPPYDGRKGGSKMPEEGDVVALEAMPSGSGAASGTAAAAAEDLEAGQSSDRERRRRRSSQLGLPPAYDAENAPGGPPVTTPPPAVTHDPHLGRPSA